MITDMPPSPIHSTSLLGLLEKHLESDVLNHLSLFSEIRKHHKDGVAARSLYFILPFCFIYALLCFPILCSVYLQNSISTIFVLGVELLIFVPVTVILEVWTRCMKPRSEKIIFFSLLILTTKLTFVHICLFLETQQLHFFLFGFEINLEVFQVTIVNTFMLSLFTIYLYFSVIRSNLLVLNRKRFWLVACFFGYVLPYGIVIAQMTHSFPSKKEDFPDYITRIGVHSVLTLSFGPLLTDFALISMGGFRSRNRILPLITFSRGDENEAPRIAISYVNADQHTLDESDIA
ncbi:unnamed protein product [Caenorhabditis brenneri]